MSSRRYRGALGLLGIGIGACLACACGSSSSGVQATQPSTPTSTAPHVARCAPGRANVIATSQAAVVYTLPRVLPAGPGPRARQQGVAIFGCLVGSGRPVSLGTAARVDRIALNQAAVAYVTTAAQGIDTIATSVVVADVRRGRQLFNVPAGHISIAPHFVTVDALAVTAGGTVAWIQHGGTLESPGYSVHVASVAKPGDHLVASGSAINPRSLKLTPTSVSWVDAGQARSAPI